MKKIWKSNVAQTLRIYKVLGERKVVMDGEKSQRKAVKKASEVGSKMGEDDAT